ncbi:MAG: 6-phosphofructokinase [Ruminococcaceae bacterium]|nr:6-phosphofructokinase [Oscillospiraceae bacterium]
MEGKKIRRIALLTSGGDAPGMNAAIRSVVRTAIYNDIQVLGIRRGYNGLIKNDFFPMDSRSVNKITAQGGTMLYTARCAEFQTPEGLQRAADNCKYLGIEGLVCIGGDGTFRGAQALSEYGVQVVGIPATIDNDIACTHYSIGFDTAANTAIDAIDKLSDTMQSHERISVVEVMGRHAGHLALYVGLSVGAAVTLIPEEPYDMQRDIIDVIREGRIHGRNHSIVIVAEGVGNTNEIVKTIEAETGVETRLTVIGHIQRGGSPSARDRVMGTRMGHYAVEALMQGQNNVIVCYRDSQLCTVDCTEALSMKKKLDGYMYRVGKEVAI